MGDNYYSSENLVSHNTILKKYKLTNAELWKLIAESKLHPLSYRTRIFFNKDAVECFFVEQNKIDKPPITISSQDIIGKYNLTRVEFSKLISDKLLIPLPLQSEKNLHFEYKMVCAYFADCNIK